MNPVSWVVNSNFSQFVLGKPVTVLCFRARWESSDRYTRYRIRELASIFPDVSFGLIDMDLRVNEGIVSCLAVKNVPTTIWFHRGCNVHTLSERVSLLTLVNDTEEVLRNARWKERLRSQSKISQPSSITSQRKIS